MGASGWDILGNFVQGTEMGLAGEGGDAVVSQLADHSALRFYSLESVPHASVL